MVDPKKVDELIKMANKNGGDNADAVKSIVSKLSENDKKRLSEALNDKERMQQLLSSPQAQALLKRFGGK